MLASDHLVTMISQNSLFRVTVLTVIVVPTASTETRISYPSFSPHEVDFMALWDSKYDSTNQSYIINPGARVMSLQGSCGALLYKQLVRIQNVATGRVASFNMSCSFRFATHGLPWTNGDNPADGSGFAFAIIRNTPLATMRDGLLQFERFGACRSYRSQARILLSVPRSVVHVDTDYNANLKDPSKRSARVEAADAFSPSEAQFVGSHHIRSCVCIGSCFADSAVHLFICNTVQRTSGLGYSKGPHACSLTRRFEKQLRISLEKNVLGEGGSGVVCKGSLQGEICHPGVPVKCLFSKIKLKFNEEASGTKWRIHQRRTLQ